MSTDPKTTTVPEADADLVIEVEASTEGTPAPIAIQNGIATVPVAALATEVGDWREKLPKAIRALMSATPEPEEGELSALVDNLPSADAELCRSMFEGLNPVREGVISSVAEMKIPTASIYQGTGDDAARPTTAPKGSLYTSRSELLCCYEKALARQNGVQQTVAIVPLLLIKSRTWWKPRRESFVLPEGVDPNSKAPICQSPDRVQGSRYGACSACPNRPYAKGSYDADSCTDDAMLFFVVRGYVGIFSMNLKGASLKDAVGPLDRSKGKMYDRWWELSLVNQTNARGSWFTVKLSPLDADAGGVATTTEERHVFRALSATLLHQAAMPLFERVYNARAREAVATATGEVQADTSAVLKAAAQDYSQGGPDTL